MKKSRIYRHYKRIFFDYKRKETTFENTMLQNELWHIKEAWSLFVGIDKHIFRVDKLDYDGHTIKGFTFFWVCLGLSYGYESKPASKVMQEVRVEKPICS